MNRQLVLVAILLLVFLQEVDFACIFTSFNHMQEISRGEAGRTFTREVLLLLRERAKTGPMYSTPHRVAGLCWPSPRLSRWPSESETER